MPERRTATEQTRSNGLSDLFIHHEILVTEADLHDWLTIERLPHCRRLFLERRYFDKAKVLRFKSNGKTFRLQPDSGAMIEIGGTESTPTASIWFKEIDRGTESFRKLKTKFRVWDGWAQSDEGEEYLRTHYADHGYHYSRPTFKLQVIAHANSRDPADDFHRLVWLFTAALSVSPRIRRRMYFTTAALMQAVLRQERFEHIPAAAPIWWRLRDANSWLEEYRAFVSELPKGTGQKRYVHMRQFVTQRLQTMPQYSLFPP